VYFQYRSLEGRTRQLYLGPDNEATETRAQRLREFAAARAEQHDSTQAIAAAFLAAGGFRTEHAPMRVLRAFSDAGVLRPGSARPVLIGTHAFHALGNLLGVRWDSPMQTQDMDLAADTDVDLAIPPDMPGISSTLEQLEMRGARGSARETRDRMPRMAAISQPMPPSGIGAWPWSASRTSRNRIFIAKRINYPSRDKAG